MNARKTELVVGIFAIAIFAVLTFMTFKVGEFTIGKKPGYVVYAYFHDTAGLYEQTKIKVAGVDAGTLEDIALINGVARLTLRMDPEVELYSDASAGIRTTGLLGDKFLEVKVGSASPNLKDGDTIQYVEEFVDIDDMFQNLDSLSENVTQIVSTLNEPEMRDAFRESVTNLRDITESLKTVITGNENRLDRIIARVDSLTSSLDELVASNKAPLSNTISNLEEFSGALKYDGPGLVSDLHETVNELKEVIHDNKEDINNLVKKTSTTMDSINAVAQKVDRGEGTIGKLVNDESLYNSLTNAVSGIGNTVSAINRFRTFITFRGEYLERIGDGKGGFYLTLQPRKDKYYILGVVGDPIGQVEVTDTFIDGTHIHEEKIDKDIEFTAQFAKRFNNTALRIGIVESSFGLGVDQFLLDDKLRLYADAWDFETDEHLADKAHLNVGADYFIFKNFFISGGVDNILNSHRTGVFVGGGVRFEDEDFKYLFGTSLPNVPK
jgi:phospholipid/cholesterol/gamma-HCH transport system substrate-binding protein